MNWIMQIVQHLDRVLCVKEPKPYRIPRTYVINKEYPFTVVKADKKRCLIAIGAPYNEVLSEDFLVIPLELGKILCKVQKVVNKEKTNKILCYTIMVSSKTCTMCSRTYELETPVDLCPRCKV